MLFKPLLLIAGLGVGLVLSTPMQETNAQRLARGLPPSPPKFLRDAEAQVLGPTRVSSAFYYSSRL